MPSLVQHSAASPQHVVLPSLVRNDTCYAPGLGHNIFGLDQGKGKANKCRGNALELDSMEVSLAECTFAQALETWITELNGLWLQPRTINDYRQYGRPLGEYLGSTLLKDIGLLAVRGYQFWRSKEADHRTMPTEAGEAVCRTCKIAHAPDSYAHRASNVRIRNEINGALKPLLKEIDTWERIKKRFKHLPVPIEGSGMLLTREDQREILKIAFAGPVPRDAHGRKLGEPSPNMLWTLAGHCLLIMYRSGFGPGELFKVRRRDVDEEAGKVGVVRGAKNQRRLRFITVVHSVIESFQWLMRRADDLGAVDRNDYILPHRSHLVNRHGAFDKPMTTLHHTWVAIRAEWIRQHPEKKHKAKARCYDARVSAATHLMSNRRLTMEVVDKVLGWRPNSRMRQRYLQAEQDIMYDALNTLEEDPARKPSRFAQDGGEAVEDAG